MTTREVQMLVGRADGAVFSVHVEPEGTEYRLPPHERILLTFVGPVTGVQYLEVSHGPDALIIGRPADTEVWVTLADGTHEQIGGFVGNPFPWLDAGGDRFGQQAPWTWPA